MADKGQLVWQDVTDAFAEGHVLTAPSDQLLEYLLVLGNTQVHSEENGLLANNRCITINTILTHRLTREIDRSTTRFTIATIVLGIIGVAITVVGIALAS